MSKKILTIRKQKPKKLVANLVIYVGSRTEHIELDQEKEYSVGRRTASDICLTDPTISRIHGRLHYSENAWKFEDLHSTNGTFVSGSENDADKILHGTKDKEESVVLEEGMVLEIGETMIRFKYLPELPKPDVKRKTDNLAYMSNPSDHYSMLSCEDIEKMINIGQGWIAGLNDLLKDKQKEEEKSESISA